jgi:hypothetical protein
MTASEKRVFQYRSSNQDVTFLKPVDYTADAMTGRRNANHSFSK